MRRFTKISVIFCAIIFVIGLVCIGIGKMLGFNYINNGWDNYQMAYKYNWIADTLSNVEYYIDHLDLYELNTDYNSSYNVEVNEHIDDVINVIEEEIYEFDDNLRESEFSVTSNMRINCRNGAILIEEYEGDTIQIHSSLLNKHLNCYTEKDTLIIEDMGSRDDKGPIKIYVPADTQFEEVNITLRTGSIISIGSLSIKDILISCNYGSVNLQLNGNEKDYGYSLNNDLGSIILNGESHFGIISSERSERIGEYNLDLEVKMGSIKIDFYE